MQFSPLQKIVCKRRCLQSQLLVARAQVVDADLVQLPSVRSRPVQWQLFDLVAVTEITVEPRLIPPAGRGALMGLRSRTRLTKSKRQPKSGPFYFLRRYFGKEN
jgi:hypothetical protein